MAFQDHLRNLGQLAGEAYSAGWITEMPSLRDSVHVAVIGEIKRGKSTFLNALMGEKVFPSRSSVCTTAVTFLEDGPAAIQAIYLPALHRPPETRSVAEGENIFDCLQDMVAKPNSQGKKGNPHSRDLDSVVVTYPNRFATDGVRLVDTPGVNDPEAWREEITFQFLPQVDAALMLLDPQQPLSKSEMDFLQNRATKAVKDQLLVVVSRCDEVTPADLEKSVARIRRELSVLLPDLRLFSVASKPALEAKKANEPIPEAWANFEQALDQFLHEGKAGTLLLSRAQGICDEVSAVHSTKIAHLDSLSRRGAEETARLDQEQRELDRIGGGLTSLRLRAHSLLTQHRERLFSQFEIFLITQRSALRQASNEELPNFASRYLRDLQEHRLAWMEKVALDLEEVLQQEVLTLVDKTCNVRAFRIPDIGGLHSAPSFSTPAKGDVSSGFLPGLVGGIVGTVFGGPLIGAGLAFLTRSFFSSEGGQNQTTYDAFRKECEDFLRQSTESARQDVDSLLQGMESGWIPQFFDPLEQELLRQSHRVSDTQADLNKSEQERDQKRQLLVSDRNRLEDFLNRINIFLADLRSAGRQLDNDANDQPYGR